jgi:hypothetical protein
VTTKQRTQRIERRRVRALPFVCLPKPLCLHPPIAHRGAPADGLLTVFEVAVAEAILTLARPLIVPERHARAFAKSRKAIAKKRGRYSAPKEARQEAFQQEYDVYGRVSHDFRREGATAYRVGRRQFDRAKLPGAVTIEVSRRALLRAANLSPNSRNALDLDAALNRLRRPVRAGAKELPGLLQHLRRLTHRRLRLAVDPQWLPRVIGRVPTPLPTRGGGTTVLALFLLLCGGIDQRPQSRTMIDLETLCRRIGIAFRYPAEACARLRKVLKAVNDHLRDLDQAALVTEKLPTEFQLCLSRDETRVHFRTIKVRSAQPETEVEARTGIAVEQPQEHEEHELYQLGRELGLVRQP